jgi:hypothetical protein
LGLGDHLVHELGLSDGVDTLGRWMSHHVAELIVEARKPGKGKPKAERVAREAILRLWEYRRVLPGRAYPLAKFDKVIEFLEVLRPSDGPFAYFSRRSEKAEERAAAELFDSFSRLLATLLLSRVVTARPSKRRQAAQRALTGQERDLLDSLDRIVRLAIPPRQKPPRVRAVFSAEAKVKAAKADETDHDKAAPEPTNVAIEWLGVIAEQVSVLKSTLLTRDQEP